MLWKFGPANWAALFALSKLSSKISASPLAKESSETERVNVFTTPASANLTADLEQIWSNLDKRRWIKGIENDVLCDYKPPKSKPPTRRSLEGVDGTTDGPTVYKRYANANELSLDSHWIERQYVFNTRGHFIHGFTGEVVWHVVDQMQHDPHDTGFEGSCTKSYGNNKNTIDQFLGGTEPRYLMDTPKDWLVDTLYRGHISRAQAFISQWFSFKTKAGKFAIHVEYKETYNNVLFQIDPKDGWANRIISEANCKLHFHMSDAGGYADFPSPDLWAFYIQALRYDDSGVLQKRQMPGCATSRTG